MSQTFQEFLDNVSSAQLDEATPGEDNPKSPEELKAKRRGKKGDEEPVDGKVDAAPETDDTDDIDQEEPKSEPKVNPEDPFAGERTQDMMGDIDAGIADAAKKLKDAENIKTNPALRKIGKKKLNPKKFVNTKPSVDEAPRKGVAVISFGRMNPVTVGHEKLVNKVISTALSKGGTPLIYLSQTQDSKKNPLTYDQKILFAKRAFGNKVIVKSRARTIIEVAKELQRQYSDLVLVVGSDRVDEFSRMLNQYNGRDYTFNNIEVISAGERDPDSEGVTGMSASKMRQAAADDDFTSFKKGLPTKLKTTAKTVYDAVRVGMGLQETMEIEFEDFDDEFLDEIFMDENLTEDLIGEALTRQQRLKRKMLMKRMRSKLRMGRRRAMKRVATVDVLKRRARRLVYRMLKKRFSKAVDYGDMPYSARQRVDDRIKKIPKNRIDILMRRFLPKVKKAERARLASKMKAKSSPLKPKKIKIMKVDTSPAKKGPKKPKEFKKESLDYAVMNFLSERVKNGKLDPLSPMGKSKLTGREVAQYYRDNPAAKRAARDEKTKLAIELALDLGGNMNYAIKEIEKIKRGLSKHPEVRKALQHVNESAEHSYKEYTLEQRMNEGPTYHTGLAKSTADKRKAQFKKQAKMDDDNPKAYKPAPGDATAETKPSQHTKNFKKMFGETNYERAGLKRPHMLLARNGSVVVDKRFKINKKAEQIAAERSAKIKELEQIGEELDFIFESNPKKSLKKKAEKTGIPYGILKKVFDRGVAAWRTGHRPGTTPTQWGLARVNSFATGGKTQKTTDADLWKQHKGKD